jgi:hypothetical protein
MRDQHTTRSDLHLRRVFAAFSLVSARSDATLERLGEKLLIRGFILARNLAVLPA